MACDLMRASSDTVAEQGHLVWPILVFSALTITDVGKGGNSHSNLLVIPSRSKHASFDGIPSNGIDRTTHVTTERFDYSAPIFVENVHFAICELLVKQQLLGMA